VALVGAVGAVVGPHLGLGLNLSASAPRGLYRKVTNAPARGALVIVCLPPPIARFGRARGYLGAGDCPGGTQPVLKRIAASAGDALELAPDGVSVNGVRVQAEPLAERDSAGRPLPHAAFGSHRVTSDEVWLSGISPGRSWDSRYFGSVPASAVRAAVRPMLTVNRRGSR